MTKTTTLYYATPAAREQKIKSGGLPAHLAHNARNSFLAGTIRAARKAASKVACEQDVDMQIWRVKCPQDVHVEGGFGEAVDASCLTLMDTITSLDDDVYDSRAA